MVTDAQPQVPMSLGLAQTALPLLCLRNFLSLAVNTQVCHQCTGQQIQCCCTSDYLILRQLFHFWKTRISWETQLLPSKVVLYLMIWTNPPISKKKKAYQVSIWKVQKSKERRKKSWFLRKSYGLGPQWTIFACLSLILSQLQKWNPKNPQEINKSIDADKSQMCFWNW